MKTTQIHIGISNLLMHIRPMNPGSTDYEVGMVAIWPRCSMNCRNFRAPCKYSCRCASSFYHICSVLARLRLGVIWPCLSRTKTDTSSYNIGLCQVWLFCEQCFRFLLFPALQIHEIVHLYCFQWLTKLLNKYKVTSCSDTNPTWKRKYPYNENKNLFWML